MRDIAITVQAALYCIGTLVVQAAAYFLLVDVVSEFPRG